MGSLNYSLEHKQIVPMFLQYRNSIIIYTEDKECDKEFYVQFYQHLLEGTGVHLNDVTQLGSCRDVEAAYLNESDFSKPKLYVVDGDIQVLYNPKQEKDFFFPLKRYCIENYLVDEDPLIETLYVFLGKYNKEVIKTKLSYRSSLQKMAENIIPLFYYFSILDECGLPFTLNKIHRFFEKDFKLDEIEKVKKQMHGVLLSNGLSESDIQRKLLDRQTRYPQNEDSAKIIICGKDYIFEYFKCLVKSCFDEKNLNVSPAAWKLNCCKYMDLAPLDSLKQKILNIWLKCQNKT